MREPTQELVKELVHKGWYVHLICDTDGVVKSIIGQDEWTTNSTGQAIILPEGRGQTMREAILASIKDAIRLYDEDIRRHDGKEKTG